MRWQGETTAIDFPPMRRGGSFNPKAVKAQTALAMKANPGA